MTQRRKKAPAGPPAPNLPINVDECLSATKLLFTDAEIARRRRDGPSRRQAVIAYDVAIEDVLDVLGLHLGCRPTGEANRAAMCRALQRALTSGPDAMRVRAIRNPAMHARVTPSPQEVEEAAVRTQNVLRDAFRAAGRDFDTFTLVPLLCNALIRDPLGSALQAADPTIRLAWCVIAWDRLEGLTQEALLLASGEDASGIPQPLWSDLVVVAKCANGAAEQLLQSVQVAAGDHVSGDFASVLRMRELRTELIFSDPADGSAARARGAPIAPTDSAWAVDFIARTAYELERANPAFRQPIQAPRNPESRIRALPFVVRRRR
jgi:hypothetical protein